MIKSGFRARICMLLAMLVLFSTIFCFGDTSISDKINQEMSITDDDLSKIQQNLEYLLNSQYMIMRDWKFQSCENIISDSQLLKLVDKTNQFKSQWYEKVGLKISEYNSELTINTIEKLKENTYLIAVTFDIDFYLEGRDTPSSSKGEKYQFEVKKDNDEWYITKMLNNPENSLKELRAYSDIENITISQDKQKNNYDAITKSKVETINEISNNIDKYLEEYNKTQDSIKNSESGNFTTLYSGYDPDPAIQYAHDWADGYNPDYTYYEYGDCTNFVSQCVEHGGIPTTTTWEPDSYAWIRVTNFYSYMINQGYASKDVTYKDSRLGDVIQLYYKPEAKWYHTVIITGKDNTGWLYTAHTQTRVDYPIANVYPSTDYTNIRYIKFWH